MSERNATRSDMHSPSREAIARYEARILAYDLARESRVTSGRGSPPFRTPGRDASTTSIASPYPRPSATLGAPSPCAADRRPHRPDPRG